VVPEEKREALYQAYLEELTARYPRFQIIKKGDSGINRLIDKFLRVVTFGKQTAYLDGYVTTLGQRIYVPDDWDRLSPGYRYCTMRHEVIHVEQFRRFTWPGMFLLYILLPLPMGFSGRRFIELPAYKESLTATWQVYGEEKARSELELNSIVRQFTGPAYAWMWLNGSAIRKALKGHLDRLGANPPEELC